MGLKYGIYGPIFDLLTILAYTSPSIRITGDQTPLDLRCVHVEEYGVHGDSNSVNASVGSEMVHVQVYKMIWFRLHGHARFPPVMVKLTNDFSWSYSRHVCFQTCLRRYYYTYYGAWGGWDETAPTRTRHLYMLKRLSTRQQWAGTHIHRAIERLLNTPQPMPSSLLEETLTQEILQDMRNEFRASRAKEYRRDPVHISGLLEHEYDVPVSTEEWRQIADRVAEGIRNFLNSPLWAEFFTLPPTSWLGIEKKDSFLLDGLHIFSVVDAIRQSENTLSIYDWKTGQADLENHKHQLGVYALYARHTWPQATLPIQAILYNPITGAQRTYSFGEEDLEETKEFIHDSADEMLFPLDDPKDNTAQEDAFDFTDDVSACKNCAFLRLCPRWAANSVM